VQGVARPAGRDQVAALELQQQQAVAAMGVHVERGTCAAGWQPNQQQRRCGSRGEALQLLAKLHRDLGAERLRQGVAGTNAAAEQRGVGAGLDDRQCRLAQDQQHAMRLDRGCVLDLLAVAAVARVTDRASDSARVSAQLGRARRAVSCISGCGVKRR
jgi:hypothetical protein